MRIQLIYCTALLATGVAVAGLVGVPQAAAEPLQTICVATVAGNACRSAGHDVPNALPTVSSRPSENLLSALGGRW
jgi:hypothetical protein